MGPAPPVMAGARAVRLTWCRLWRLAAPAAGWLLMAGVPAIAPAQPRSLPITEEEIYGYLDALFDSQLRCDDHWLGSQFEESATLEFIYEDGQTEVLSPAQYLEGFRKHCRPYEPMKWDKTGLSVSTSGRSATVKWKMWWGRQEDAGGVRSSKLRFEDTASLVRSGWVIRIAWIREEVHELVPGAAREYRERTGSESLAEIANRFYRNIVEHLVGRREPQPADKPL